MRAKKHSELKVTEGKKSNVFKEKIQPFFHSLVSTKKRRILTIIAGVVLLVVVLFAIPFTRYFILSPFVKKDVVLTIVDSKTSKPVSNVAIELGGISSETDKDGVVSLQEVPVGQYDIKITKQYYQESVTSYTVPVLSAPDTKEFDIVAVGRQVTVNVTNKITNEPLGDVLIEASGTQATTNTEGQATIILPPTNEVIEATLTKENFNTTNVELKVDDTIVNEYSLAASGSIYYLSKATGQINVMKSNLDGSDVSVAVAGTGQESDYSTALLASKDWQYAALRSTRADTKERLYMINATTNDFKVIDEGDTSFSLVGWHGHTLVYTVVRDSPNVWDNKRQALKSYNADTGKITTLDETSGSGKNVYDAAYESYGGTYILNGEVVYQKNWTIGLVIFNDGTRELATISSVNTGGGSKKVLKSFTTNNVSTRLLKPDDLYVRAQQRDNAINFYEYTNGELKDTTSISDTQFNSSYFTYVTSPSGKQTLWYEPRDGKNTVLVGNQSADNSKVLANLSEYYPYGWYGQDDEYVLLTKNGGELYISSSSKVVGEDGYEPLRIGSIHGSYAYTGNGYGSQ